MEAIVGHGVDVVDLAEFAAMIASSGELFVDRCFTEHEKAYAGEGPNRCSRLAARFAAKEAVLKAVGTGWSNGISWKDVEIIHQSSGAPLVNVSGSLARFAAGRKISRFLVSLSHTKNLAIASVIALGDDAECRP